MPVLQRGVRTTVEEEPHKRQPRTVRGNVQRRPLVVVLRVDEGEEVRPLDGRGASDLQQQLLCALDRVVVRTVVQHSPASDVRGDRRVGATID
eukprot:1121185-Prymnesium_polylepis.2